MRRLLPYLRYVKPQARLLIIALLCGVIYGAASGFGVPFFIEKVFKSLFEDRVPVYGLTAGWAAALLSVVFLVRGVSGYFNQFLLQIIGVRVLTALRRDLYKKLTHLPLSFFERNTSGDLMSRLVGDTALMQYTITLLANDLLRQPVQLIGGLSFLIYLTVRNDEAVFLMLFVAVIPVVIYPIRVIGRNLKKRGHEAQDAMGRISNHIGESLIGATEVRSFNLAKPFGDRMASELNDYERSQSKSAKYITASQPLMEFIAATVVSLAFYYAYENDVGASLFLAMGTALYFCFDPLKRLIRLHNDVQRAYGAMDRIETVLKENVAISEPTTPAPIDIEKVRGEIDFSEVKFGYSADVSVFNGLSKKIEPGEVVALVGPSGSGKSTFAKLVPRFYEVSGGGITIDGVDVRQWPLEKLRDAVAVVPQQPVLFNDTIAANIRLGKLDASDAEVEAAAIAAYAHDFIKSLPDGYQTEVGENALRLSGGQRQRLALARAFLKNAPILILDEATSALDNESEHQVQLAIQGLIAGKTVLIIAHRPNTINLASRILVFDKGQIVGDGSREHLLQSSPLFKSLFGNSPRD